MPGGDEKKRWEARANAGRKWKDMTAENKEAQAVAKKIAGSTPAMLDRIVTAMRERRADEPRDRPKDAWEMRPKGTSYFNWGVPLYPDSILETMLASRNVPTATGNKKCRAKAKARPRGPVINFHKRCEMVRVADIPDLDLWKRIKGVGYSSNCEAAGFCVCDPATVHLVAVQKCICSRALSPDKEHRQKVRDAHTFLRLTTERAAAEADGDTVEEKIVRWFHISYQLFNPQRLTVTQLSVVSPEQSADVPNRCLDLKVCFHEPGSDKFFPWEIRERVLATYNEWGLAKLVAPAGPDQCVVSLLFAYLLDDDEVLPDFNVEMLRVIVPDGEQEYRVQSKETIPTPVSDIASHWRKPKPRPKQATQRVKRKREAVPRDVLEPQAPGALQDVTMAPDQSEEAGGADEDLNVSTDDGREGIPEEEEEDIDLDEQLRGHEAEFSGDGRSDVSGHEGCSSEGRPSSIDGDGGGHGGGGGGGAKAGSERPNERPALTSESSDADARVSDTARRSGKPTLCIVDVEWADTEKYAECFVCREKTISCLRMKKALGETPYGRWIHLRCADYAFDCTHVRYKAAMEGAGAVVGMRRWLDLTPDQQEEVLRFLA